MKRITTKINFSRKTTTDVSECIQHFDILVPEDVTEKKVEKEIKRIHKILMKEDDGEAYKKNGLIPSYLLTRVCEENGWTFEDIDYGINLLFQI